MRYRSHKRMLRKRGKWIAGAAVLLLLLLLCLAVVGIFRIRTVEVAGNNYYTEKEIKDMVISDRYSANSLYLYLKYRYFQTEEIPFVDKIEVSLLSAGKVRIRVYEKSLIGYASYMGTNLYFDKDGIVVESSSDIREDVPEITGLQFHSQSLYQRLGVKDDSVFSSILNVTQLLQKNELYPDQIEFKKNLDLLLHFEDVKVALGKGEQLEEKIGRLRQFLPELEGQSGTLHMENYSEDSSMVSFKRDGAS
ncbi:MAG: FtsQ-type POTRA domain-containing protein [Lachnospiraceae bacterium]|nr:FtsQ-type POTRA domain-containing protein [Lachnospiraceae bacterium]